MGSGHRQATASTGQHYERHPVSCDIEGDVYSGHYWVAGMILVVSTATGGTSRQLAGQPPAVLARTLLREFILARRDNPAALSGQG